MQTVPSLIVCGLLKDHSPDYWITMVFNLFLLTVPHIWSYFVHLQMKLPWDIGFSIMRMFCLLYLTPCFVVDETKVVLRYYNSIYWMFHIILFVLMLIAVIIFKCRGENWFVKLTYMLSIKWIKRNIVATFISNINM